jgi:hypothetical protein
MKRLPADTQQRSAPARWQSGYAGDCKSPYIGSIPVRASSFLPRTRAMRVDRPVSVPAARSCRSAGHAPHTREAPPAPAINYSPARRVIPPAPPRHLTGSPLACARASSPATAFERAAMDPLTSQNRRYVAERKGHYFRETAGMERALNPACSNRQGHPHGSKRCFAPWQ